MCLGNSIARDRSITKLDFVTTTVTCFLLTIELREATGSQSRLPVALFLTAYADEPA